MADQREDKGNIFMLKEKLNSNKLDQKKLAMKTIISAMTVGEDNMESDNLELKKLIYLYVINYAKTHPDLVILAINSFRKDALEANNPILRALAVRTMGCIRVSQITEYLVNPLREALKDEDSYVRKTGVICVIKMYDSNPELIESLGFIEMLQNLLTDGNPMVVSNAVAALEQISLKKGVDLIKINDYLANKLLAATNEATEWGKTYILDAMANYVPSSTQICEDILERIASNLSHQNPGIVLSTIRIIIKYMDYISNMEVIRNLCRRVSPVLMTLMTCDHEFQYVVLKNINIIIQKRPMILEKEIKMFFCKYTDPHYIKLEKLEILLKLSDDNNIHQILQELKEYVLEVDVDFVRKCIRTFGRLAIKLENSKDACVKSLFECLQKKASYMIQESITVMRDIFRKYPNKYENSLSSLLENVNTIKEPEAKSSLIWIIGEYAQQIEGSGAILSKFLETFNEESIQVQLNLLTAIVRYYLGSPKEGGPLCEQIFKIVKNAENPDLRDRGYIYWRIIGKNPQLAQQLLLRQKPVINDLSYRFESNLLEKLVDGISSLSAVYFKEPEAFVKILRDSKNQRWEEMEEEGENEADVIDSTGKMMGSYQPKLQNNEIDEAKNTGIDLLGGNVQIIRQNSQPNPVRTVPTPIVGTNQVEVDLLSGEVVQPVISTPQNAPQFSQSTSQGEDTVVQNIKIPSSLVLSNTTQGVTNKNSGVQVQGSVQKEGNNTFMILEISNQTSSILENLQLRVNKNSYKLNYGPVALPVVQIGQGQTQKVNLKLTNDGQSNGEPPKCPFSLQVALNTNVDVFVFNVNVSFSCLLCRPLAILGDQEFEELMARPNQVKDQKNFDTKFSDMEQVKQKFENNHVYMVNRKTAGNGNVMMNFYTETIDGNQIGIRAFINGSQLYIQYQVPHPAVVPLVFQAIKFINDF